MTDKEQFKAEIEKVKLIIQSNRAQGAFAEGYLIGQESVLEHFENFVNSMQEEPVAPKVLKNMFNAKTAAESLGISQEEHDRIVDELIYGKEPELVDSDDLPKEEPVSEDFEKEIEQASLKFFPLPPCYNEEQRKSKDYADSWYRARDEQNGFKHGAFWCKRHFVNAACEWLRNHLSDYWYKEDKYFNISGCIYEFKDAMIKE